MELYSTTTRFALACNQSSKARFLWGLKSVCGLTCDVQHAPGLPHQASCSRVCLPVSGVCSSAAHLAPDVQQGFSFAAVAAALILLECTRHVRESNTLLRCFAVRAGCDSLTYQPAAVPR
jgi:hypothetical protein